MLLALVRTKKYFSYSKHFKFFYKFFLTFSNNKLAEIHKNFKANFSKYLTTKIYKPYYHKILKCSNKIIFEFNRCLRYILKFLKFVKKTYFYH